MKKKIMIGAVVSVALVGGFLFMSNRSVKNEALPLSEMYTEVAVSKQTIVQSISGSGVLEPADSYAAMSLVTGEVLKADFEEGDYIPKDTLLYTIDSSVAQQSIEQAELSLRQSQTNYDRAIDGLNDLNMYANKSGVVTSLDVKVGDTIGAGQKIATVKDNSKMLLNVPFVSADADQMWVGQAAVVTLEGIQGTVNGIVSSISPTTMVGAGNSILKMVEIMVNNPGSIGEDSKAFAKVGNFASADAGKFEFLEDAALIASNSGEIAALHLRKNGWVNNGDLMIKLSDKNVQRAITDASYGIENAQMTLDKQSDVLDNYQIESPISGTVVEKNIKKGDTLSEPTTLCTIFDLSYLKVILYVDELDIAKTSVGQVVDITVDAIEDSHYTGKITKINIKGVTSNGVTMYPVTIQLDDAGDLLPGMNANMKIVVKRSENALSIPIDAVGRGNKVLIKTDEPVGETGQNNLEKPAGTKLVEVKTGISDDKNVEILSGLSEGDIVLIDRLPVENGMMMQTETLTDESEADSEDGSESDTQIESTTESQTSTEDISETTSGDE